MSDISKNPPPVCMHADMQCMNGWRDGCMDGWLAGWRDGWMDGFPACLHYFKHIVVHSHWHAQTSASDFGTDSSKSTGGPIRLPTLAPARSGPRSAGIPAMLYCLRCVWPTTDWSLGDDRLTA